MVEVGREWERPCPAGAVGRNSTYMQEEWWRWWSDGELGVRKHEYVGPTEPTRPPARDGRMSW